MTHPTISSPWKRNLADRLRFVGGVRMSRNDGGSTAVEFGMTLPLLLLVTFAVIELGRLGYAQAVLSFAAEEATRFAIVREGQVTNEQIEDYASTKLLGLDQNIAVFTATSPVSAQTGTSLLTVQIRYPFRFLTPFVSGDTFTLSAESRGFYAFPAAIQAGP